jgi:tRNA threonylcarbamoyladenosine biosynthesis protein TsaE
MHNANHNGSPAKITRRLADESETAAVGARLAGVLMPGMVIYLCGDLGAGKTTLARALLRALGYTGKVKSPTYTLVESYVISNLYLYHFDFYRFSDPHEWDDAGFREYFNPHTVCLVEWPEKAGGLLPPPDLRVTLRVQGAGREIEIAAETERGRQCLGNL